MSNTAVAKFNMIQQQIRPWEVLDNQVLSVFDEVFISSLRSARNGGRPPGRP